jgi:MFS family permease
LFYGYILVAAAFGIQIVAWGLFNSYGVFFTQFLTKFGWPRETISGAFSLGQVLIGIGAIFLGKLNDRFGPRLLMTFCGMLAGFGYALMSQINSVWQLYLFHGVIVGIGLSGTDVVLLSTTARWFVKRRGIMSGIVKIGTGVGILVIPIINTWLISLYEWRNTLIIIGSTLFILVVSCAQLLRRDPSQMKLLPDGEEPGIGTDVPLIEAGLSLKQACYTRQFWMLCYAYFTVLLCTNTVIVHIAPYAVDLELSASFAATMLATIGGSSIVGRLGMGIVNDIIGSKRALLVCFVILIVSFSWLQLSRGTWSLFLFTLVYGFSHGGFYAILSPTVAEFFGTRSHGLLLGIVIFIGSLGGAIGPVIAGRIFDTTLSYQTAFLMLLILATSGFILTILSGSVERRIAS